MLDEEVEAALARSSLANLEPALLGRITDGAARLEVPPGTTSHQPDRGPTLALVLRGLLRMYMASPEGRQVTLRYGRPGSLLGVATLFSDVPMVLVQEALVASRLLVMRGPLVRDLANADARLAVALLRETSDRVQTYIAIAGGNVFASVRQRVIANLLDIAEVQRGEDHELVAAIDQQQLADAAGSVREVVVRVLHDLREAGLVRTGRSEIVLVDPSRLEVEVRPQGM
jgi:CRP/FNR family cyclic AMP-dependent transcriptional regulator